MLPTRRNTGYMVTYLLRANLIDTDEVIRSSFVSYERDLDQHVERVHLTQGCPLPRSAASTRAGTLEDILRATPTRTQLHPEQCHRCWRSPFDADTTSAHLRPYALLGDHLEVAAQTSALLSPTWIDTVGDRRRHRDLTSGAHLYLSWCLASLPEVIDPDLGHVRRHLDDLACRLQQWSPSRWDRIRRRVCRTPTSKKTTWVLLRTAAADGHLVLAERGALIVLAGAEDCELLTRAPGPRTQLLARVPFRTLARYQRKYQRASPCVTVLAPAEPGLTAEHVKAAVALTDPRGHGLDPDLIASVQAALGT